MQYSPFGSRFHHRNRNKSYQGRNQTADLRFVPIVVRGAVGSPSVKFAVITTSGIHA